MGQEWISNASPTRSLGWSTERPPSAWGPAVMLGRLSAPTWVGSISVAFPPEKPKHDRGCDHAGALDRLSLKKA